MTMKLKKLMKQLSPQADLDALKTNRILVFDIETAPAKVAFETYGLKMRSPYIPHSAVTEPGYIVSFAAVWLDDPTHPIYYDLHDKGMLRKLWNLLDVASYVIGFNSDRFDIKKVKAAFIREGFPPFRMPKSIDLIKVARKEFAIESNSLAYWCRYLETDHQKIDENVGAHGAGGLRQQVIDGDLAARARMKAYNVGDVLATADLYIAMLPWITNHPAMSFKGHGDDEVCCPRCSSDHVANAGVIQKTRIRYQQYRCLNCSGLFRGATHSRATAMAAA